jgi:DNA-binding helix-hairpin-helix protein with protein kinase domain
MIRVGALLKSRFGDVIVREEIGEGSQGTVFLVTTSTGNLALKWYADSYANARLHGSLEALVSCGPPSAHFLWPLDVISSGDSFGYLMPARSEGFISIPKLLNRDALVKNVSFGELLRAGINTVSAFRALQSRGLYYCDISHGNLFFDPRTGQVEICDNDNVGSSVTTPGLVLGTPYYMAPEIVRGEQNPSARTDAFSLGVLLFLLLFNDHPLIGLRDAAIHARDLGALKYLLGTNPVYVFDPMDASNRPVPGIHDNLLIFKNLYPRSLLDLFLRHFTVGLSDVSQRPAFGEWLRALTEAEDSITVCPCGSQNLFGSGAVCWSCRKSLPGVIQLRTNRRTILARPGLKLYGHHFDAGDPGERGAPLGEIVVNPNDGRTWGLKNRTSRNWYVEDASKVSQAVGPGRTAALTIGNRFVIDGVELIVTG